MKDTKIGGCHALFLAGRGQFRGEGKGCLLQKVGCIMSSRRPRAVSGQAREIASHLNVELDAKSPQIVPTASSELQGIVYLKTP